LSLRHISVLCLAGILLPNYLTMCAFLLLDVIEQNVQHGMGVVVTLVLCELMHFSPKTIMTFLPPVILDLQLALPVTLYVGDL